MSKSSTKNVVNHNGMWVEATFKKANLRNVQDMLTHIHTHITLSCKHDFKMSGWKRTCPILLGGHY